MKIDTTLGGFALWFYKTKNYENCLTFWDAFIIKEPYLFSIGAEFENDLNRGIIQGKLQDKFKIEGFPISENANVTEENDDKWVITDGEKIYIVKKEGRELNINTEPNYAGAYSNRGVVYSKLNQHERAIEDYDKAIALDPHFAEAYNNRGNVYAGLNLYESALKDFNKAIALNPNYAEAYGNRGIAYSTTGRYEESARDFKKAGILFRYSGRNDDSVKAFSFCFDLREELENDDVIYCGIALFLITLNADVLIELRKMKVQDETVRKTRELAERKLHNEDISEEIAAMEAEENREEMRLLFELLKRL